MFTLTDNPIFTIKFSDTAQPLQSRVAGSFIDSVMVEVVLESVPTIVINVMKHLFNDIH
jgi:hypothetical protein